MKRVKIFVLTLLFFGGIFNTNTLLQAENREVVQRGSTEKEPPEELTTEVKGWSRYLEASKLEELSKKKMDLARGRIGEEKYKDYYETRILPAVSGGRMDTGSGDQNPALSMNEGVVYNPTTDVCWDYTQQTNYWSVVGLRPIAPSDWDLGIYDTFTTDCSGLLPRHSWIHPMVPTALPMTHPHWTGMTRQML